MNKGDKIALIFIGLIALMCLYNGLTNKKPTSNLFYDQEYFQHKIDSLNNTINDLQLQKDSVQERIDTVVVKIKENSDKHEKIANDIVHNAPSDDYLFFSEYIRNNSTRLDSLYNL